MTTEHLRAVIESTSTALHYTEEWTSILPLPKMFNLTAFRNYPFSEKLFTVPEGRKGSMFYTFTGITRLYLQGTVDYFSPDQTPNHHLRCSLEPSDTGTVVESMGGSTDGTYTENLMDLCDARNLSPSISYTLNFTLETISGQPVYLDRLLIEPTPSFDIDKTTVIMDGRHTMIQYDSKWDGSQYELRTTNKTQAKMILDFNGTSVRWVAFWHRSMAAGSSMASWRVDDSAFQTFNLPAIDTTDDDTVYLEDQLFETSDFPFGEHRLEVVHLGPESLRPLSLHHLVIEKSAQVHLGPSPSPSTSSGSIPSGHSTPTNNDESNGLSQGAKIAIGVSTSIVDENGSNHSKL
ncbi:hypothetical protein CVT24_009159 [Panaeolus cyanescens]|uniref:Uncharacterized protein n=1 Tax=Panaeolus cyanescens TaxID=181874 RepID=A0A409Y8B2_9AGAR|nr:hypothetical protein CVT24_009159 [Panaeolus cyanescens]